METITLILKSNTQREMNNTVSKITRIASDITIEKQLPVALINCETGKEINKYNKLILRVLFTPADCIIDEIISTGRVVSYEINTL